MGFNVCMSKNLILLKVAQKFSGLSCCAFLSIMLIEINAASMQLVHLSEIMQNLIEFPSLWYMSFNVETGLPVHLEQQTCHNFKDKILTFFLFLYML